MRTRVIVAIAITLALVTDASAQGTGLGNVNPFTPQFNRDPLTGKLVPTQPFTGEPNHLNNAYPTQPWNQLGVGRVDYGQVIQYIDRKSTRLNSSHSQISYAVFCLKKKKYNPIPDASSMHLHVISCIC